MKYVLKSVGVIGSGFSGLAAAATLAKAGYNVTVLEKNPSIGGRARQFEAEGFTFDMGPSWYWMPEIFENFYNNFGHTTADFYDLKRLDPSYQVIFSKNNTLEIPADYAAFKSLLESIESGSGDQLDKFMADAQYKYEVGINEYVWKPGLSVTEYFDWRVIKSAFKLQMFSSIAKQIDGYFKNAKIRQILKFPVLFLGATPENTPALYSLMNYADIKLGTWYPMGGMYEIIKAFEKICTEQGVIFVTNAEVIAINVESTKVSSVKTHDDTYSFDFVVASADYHHVERNLLSPSSQLYTDEYWAKRVMAPSSLLFYLGLNTKLSGFDHHNLFFHADFDKHADEIYTNPAWPTDPLFYVSVPSITDTNIAPQGCDNVFILMPLATGLDDNEELRQRYFDLICNKIKDIKGIDLRDHIIYNRSYCINDFKADYHAFGGNAYGLANTLMQTAILKPKIHHPSIKNLYFTGQLTSPGPGVPPSIISGQVVADLIIKANTSL